MEEQRIQELFWINRARTGPSDSKGYYKYGKFENNVPSPYKIETLPNKDYHHNVNCYIVKRCLKDGYPRVSTMFFGPQNLIVFFAEDFLRLRQ